MATETLNIVFEEHNIITTFTCSGTAVNRWILEILSMYRTVDRKLIVGLDAEWHPYCKRGQQNPVALLQLCVGRRCLIFQLLHADYIPKVLKGFLADPHFRFVGVRVQEDADRLSNDHGLRVSNPVDLRALAAEGMHRPELRQAGLQALVRAVMGAELEKPKNVRMGRWDAYDLSAEQIRYACIDAFVSFEIGRKLLTGDYPPADFTSDEDSDED